MGQLRGATPFIPAIAAPTTVALSPNEQLQDILDSSNLVRAAVENINLQTPDGVNVKLITDRLDIQIGVIEDFRDQVVAQTISARVAVENAKAVLEQIQATVAAELPALRDAITQAATDIQGTLTARLDAAVNSLVNAVVTEGNQTQELLGQANNVLGQIRSAVQGAPEPLVPRSISINATQDRQEVVIPAGFVQADVGPDWLTPDGSPTDDGLSFTVETAGHTERVRKRGDWNRTYAPGHLGKEREFNKAVSRDSPPLC